MVGGRSVRGRPVSIPIACRHPPHAAAVVLPDGGPGSSSAAGTSLHPELHQRSAKPSGDAGRVLPARTAETGSAKPPNRRSSRGRPFGPAQAEGDAMAHFLNRLIEMQAGWARPFGEFNKRWLGAIYRVLGGPINDLMHGRCIGQPVHAGPTDVPVGARTLNLV